jgi:hypothetical protein
MPTELREDMPDATGAKTTAFGLRSASDEFKLVASPLKSRDAMMEKRI